MVALIQPNTHTRTQTHGTRPTLVGLPGGELTTDTRVGTVPGRVVVVLSAIVGLYVLLSLAQGGPPSIAEQSSAATAAAMPVQTELGETIVVAEAGDTYWGIARTLVGADDARSAVEQLVARNGGSDLLIGQEVIIPASIG